ncbi:hypothetical protein K523DRAFT_358814 [Schizophyllum commune Tattone D]|nr:hypothetical protein K523DRAFT_358814 [Schizophyllum commune Tattone D]
MTALTQLTPSELLRAPLTDATRAACTGDCIRRARGWLVLAASARYQPRPTLGA